MHFHVGLLLQFVIRLIIFMVSFGVHTWTDIRLNPTWVYLESKGAMKTPSIFASKQDPTLYVCRLAPTSLQGQPESRPDPEAGPKGILVLT